MSIGNADTARRLYTHFKGDMDSSKRAPNGFRKVGTGCYRMAVLEKATDVVYKIGSYESNTSEAFNSRRLARLSTRKLGIDLRIPRTRTYTIPNALIPETFRGWNGKQPRENVVAQEYAKGARHTYCMMEDSGWMAHCRCTCKQDICFATVHNLVSEFSWLEDIHSGNILVDKNMTYWLIDLAM